jgi:hypothetical protein
VHAADLEVGGVFMRISREVHKRLTREDAMEKQMLNRRGLNDLTNPVRTPARPQRMVATLAESDDVLIADPRGQMTPAQMVDQKLLALLGSCPRSLQPTTGRLRAD